MPQKGLSGRLPGAIADLNWKARDIIFARQCAAGCLVSVCPQPRASKKQKSSVPPGALVRRRGPVWPPGGRSPPQTAATWLRTAAESRSMTNGERCFNPDQQHIHEQVYVMANQHIAHRVAEQ